MERRFSPHSPLQRRESGILLHPTSLPGPWDNGELGDQAYRFVDLLAAAGQRVWQILPLNPPHGDRSPYQCSSVHAGNPMLIDLVSLQRDGWLDRAEVEGGWASKQARLGDAFRGFREYANADLKSQFDAFVDANGDWLNDFALYRVIKAEHGGAAWNRWAPPLRDRERAALRKVVERHGADLDLIRFEQFVFYRQWEALKHYANERAIRIFGDLPIFVAHDSAEVWAQRQYFQLDKAGKPTVVAGVPPDYFSRTGQRWGNPHYNWERLERDGFKWWLARIQSQLRLYDLMRIDHFRGFEAYWEVPAEEETATNGRWVKAPGDKLFTLLHERFDPLPIVAEDLGTISEEVHQLRDKHKLPGMKVLQFAFDSDAENPYLPHNHDVNSVVYTGTHDNDTTRGWFKTLPEEIRERVCTYLGLPSEDMPRPLIRAAFASVGRLAVVPFQDVLELGSEYRMNQPGTTEGNWRWRFRWEQVPPDLSERLRDLTELYGRL